MKILVLEKEIAGVKPLDFTQEIKREEALKVWELYQDGIIRELYFRPDLNTAVLVLECRNVREAEKLLDSLPLVREELITFEVVPLVPYSGFSRLFTQNSN